MANKSNFIYSLSRTAGILFAISGAILIFYFTSCTPGKKPALSGDLKDYNLIFINIDALRADHLGYSGYARDTSPFIDTLAKKGLVFENVFSNSSYTKESVSVLFSGRLPSSGGSTGWLTAAPSKEKKNIGSLFSEAGYSTALLSNSIQLKKPAFRIGFQRFECLSDQWGVSRTGPKLTARALAFARENKNHKFMMYLHYLDPHGPYKPPARLYKRFRNKIYPHPVEIYKDVRKKCHQFIKEGFGPGDPRFEDMVLRYDAEIAHTDKSVRLLFKGLEELGLLKRTFVVISADHGEEFLEHNFVEHAWTLYNESLHIPLIFWAPGVITPRRFYDRVSVVDILPTLLDLMRIPHGRDDFDGTSLFKRKGSGLYFTPPGKPIIAELMVQHRCLLRTVIKDNWKYIAAWKWLAPEDRPAALINNREFERDMSLHLDTWGPIVREELYDLTADPGEKNNLFGKAKHPDLKKILVDYREYCRLKGLKAPEVKKEKLSKEDREKLKSLGYID